MATVNQAKEDAMSVQGAAKAVKRSRQVLADVLEMKVEEIKDSSRLGIDLKLGNVIGPLEIQELWWELERVYKIPIPEEMRPSAEELLEKTAAQFDAVIAALIGNSEPLEDENPRPVCDPALSGDATM